MKSRLIYKWLPAGIMTVVLNLILSGLAFAHGGRQVGKYEFNVGFVDEPVYEGLMNGVELRVENAETEQPVVGLDQSVRIEVTHVSSGDAKTLDLQPVRDEPGHYTATLIPTAPGEYQFRFIGTIEGVQLDEAFVSGADEFSVAESSKELQIPEQQLEVREIGAAVRGATTAAEQAQDSAARANTLALVGIGVGVVGVGFGVGSLMTRKQQETGPAGNKRTALKG